MSDIQKPGVKVGGVLSDIESEFASVIHWVEGEFNWFTLNLYANLKYDLTQAKLAAEAAASSFFDGFKNAVVTAVKNAWHNFASLAFAGKIGQAVTYLFNSVVAGIDLKSLSMNTLKLAIQQFASAAIAGLIPGLVLA